MTERRIVTSRERFTAVLRARPRARILLEASTESECVARHLAALGHEVIVADPNYAPMYANRSRRTKTDKRDARTLMDACETSDYRPVHRLSEARRHVRAELAVRDALVRTRTRTRYIALVATVDDITRFRSAHQLEAYLGVVPSEQSSGEKRHLGRITKAGNGRLRWLLVEAAWRILRSESPETAALQGWTLTIAQRRGKRIAAIARRLAGVLYAMWRDGVPYDAQRIRPLALTVHERAGKAGDDRARIELTESGAASAKIPMTQDAPRRSRWIVGAVRSFAPPKCAGAIASHEEECTSANRRLSSTSRDARTTDQGRTASAEKTTLGLTRSAASQREIQSGGWSMRRALVVGNASGARRGGAKCRSHTGRRASGGRMRGVICGLERAQVVAARAWGDRRRAMRSRTGGPGRDAGLAGGKSGPRAARSAPPVSSDHPWRSQHQSWIELARLRRAAADVHP